ncbi:MAG: ATP-binding protein, partial [Nitrospira sp.]|nr:ATP-binding protein [Nitrospira sp.]
PQDLVGLVRTAAEQLDPLLQQKALRLVVCGAEEPKVVSCDGGRILQVLQNLLSNAIKFSPHGKTITISLSHQMPDDYPVVSMYGSLVAVTVCDEGIGIPEGELHTIFHKFVQSSKTKSGAGGTGLGLAICREIIHAHGGDILARNNPGGGTSMTFSLPKEAVPVMMQEE